MTALFERTFRGSGLKATQFTLLALLAQTGTASVNQLGEALACDRTTVSRALKPLIQRRLISVASGTDARERLATITQPGLETIATLMPVWRAAQAAAASLIGEPAFREP